MDERKMKRDGDFCMATNHGKYLDIRPIKNEMALHQIDRQNGTKFCNVTVYKDSTKTKMAFVFKKNGKLYLTIVGQRTDVTDGQTDSPKYELKWEEFKQETLEKDYCHFQWADVGDTYYQVQSVMDPECVFKVREKTVLVELKKLK